MAGTDVTQELDRMDAGVAGVTDEQVESWVRVLLAAGCQDGGPGERLPLPAVIGQWLDGNEISREW